MWNILKIIISSIFVSTMYGIFGGYINNWIIYVADSINSLSCYVPKQIIWILFFIFISLIIKVFYKLINNK